MKYERLTRKRKEARRIEASTASRLRRRHIADTIGDNDNPARLEVLYFRECPNEHGRDRCCQEARVGSQWIEKIVD